MQMSPSKIWNSLFPTRHRIKDSVWGMPSSVCRGCSCDTQQRESHGGGHVACTTFWPKAMLCTIFSTIWVCSHNLTICSQFGLISWDLGAVRCVSLVLSWLENKFFGNENFIGKMRCFSTLIFLFSDSFLFFFKNTMIFQ